MDEILQLIKQHGPALLFGFCLVEASGVPIPAALALLAAGAAAAQKVVSLPLLILAGFTGLLVGDIVLYILGRYTGWWLLGILCRVTTNPEACILTSAEKFYKRGRVTLVLAKFVPGLSALAAPLAGSMRMGAPEFLALDAAGAALYTGVYLSLGFLAGDLVRAAMPAVQAAGRVIEVVALLGLVGFLGWRYWQSRQQVPLKSVPRVPADVAALEPDAAVFDVRSHGYYEAGAQRIKGAQRIEPNRLAAVAPDLPPATKVYLYCTCYNEATSVRVALHLRSCGVETYVIDGGLKSWQDAGLPVEPVPSEDVVQLPDFGRRKKASVS